jgi:hypothetical protein
MKWMETIKVQAAIGREKSVEMALQDLAHAAANHPDCSGFLNATVYRHAVVPGYLAIHLFWDTEQAQIRGSVWGLNLIEILKAMGLVDHAVWIQNSKEEGDQKNANWKS